ncbi:salt tolerance down-regulator-domain-containing protein [Mycena galericulata]|nr:salt tolerance down-regulator-domain-containing protein [Mycena galericulata]
MAPPPPPPPSSVSIGKKPMAYQQQQQAPAAPPARSARAAGKAAAYPPAPGTPADKGAAKGSSNASNNNNNTSNSSSNNNKIWSTSSSEERERIRDFWLALGEEERRDLVRVEKDTVLRKMKEQQKHSCSCAVCGRKRWVLCSLPSPFLHIVSSLLSSFTRNPIQSHPTHPQERNRRGAPSPLRRVLRRPRAVRALPTAVPLIQPHAPAAAWPRPVPRQRGGRSVWERRGVQPAYRAARA